MRQSEVHAALCVVLHDVAPCTWPECARLLEMVDELGPMPVTLLVVPDYHGRGRVDRDAPFLAAMERRLALGDEIALHGYRHLDAAPTSRLPWRWAARRLLTASEGEFAAVKHDEARERIERGLRVFLDLGWPVRGFVAPAWLLGAQARVALSGFPFQYTSTLRKVYRLPGWSEVSSTSLVYSVRSPWRRTISGWWNALLYRRLRRNPLLRVGLHPADAGHPDVVEDWRRFVRDAAAERTPMTKAGWIGTLE